MKMAPEFSPDLMKDWPMNPATFFKNMVEAMADTVAMDMESISLWEKFCDENGFVLDGIVLDNPMMDILIEVAHAGQAMAIFSPQGVRIFVDIKHTVEKVKQ